MNLEELSREELIEEVRRLRKKVNRSISEMGRTLPIISSMRANLLWESEKRRR